MATESFETAFTIDTSSIKYDPGGTAEAGYEMEHLGATQVMVVTDLRIAESSAVSITLDSLIAAVIEAVLFAKVEWNRQTCPLRLLSPLLLLLRV